MMGMKLIRKQRLLRWKGASLAMAALLGAFALVACSPDAPATTATPAAPAATPETLVLDVELGDLFIRPNSVEVESGGMLRLNVTNNGMIPHDIALGDTGTALLNAGEQETITFGPLRSA
jgi:uncharacterized cupredoxin-like copper-binding protein